MTCSYKYYVLADFGKVLDCVASFSRKYIQEPGLYLKYTLEFCY